MSISKDLFLSILAMDSYNRGYGAGISDGDGSTDADGNDIDGLGSIGSAIGAATVIKESDVDTGTSGVTAGFYAIAYSVDSSGIEGWDGESTVISYRGTDDQLPDMWTGWTVGAGWAGEMVEQQMLEKLGAKK